MTYDKLTVLSPREKEDDPLLQRVNKLKEIAYEEGVDLMTMTSTEREEWIARHLVCDGEKTRYAKR